MTKIITIVKHWVLLCISLVRVVSELTGITCMKDFTSISRRVVLVIMLSDQSLGIRLGRGRELRLVQVDTQRSKSLYFLHLLH